MEKFTLVLKKQQLFELLILGRISAFLLGLKYR